MLVCVCWKTPNGGMTGIFQNEVEVYGNWNRFGKKKSPKMIANASCAVFALLGGVRRQGRAVLGKPYMFDCLEWKMKKLSIWDCPVVQIFRWSLFSLCCTIGKGVFLPLLKHAGASSVALGNWHDIKACVIAYKMSYLVQSPFGVSQEGNAVSLPDADSHSSETGSWGLPHSLGFQRCSTCHRTGGVVRAAGICLKGILKCMTSERPVSYRRFHWSFYFNV